MICGRFLFSLVAEWIGIVQHLIIVKWFKDKELTLAFGATITNEALGSFVNFWISPLIAERYSVPDALWFGSVVCFWSVVFGQLGYVLAARYASSKRKKKKNNEEAGSKGHGHGHQATKEEDDEEEEVEPKEVTKWGYIVSGFNPGVILALLVHLFYYAAVWSWVSFMNDYISFRYHYSDAASAGTTSFYSAATAVGSPLLGIFVDKVGGCGLLISVGVALQAGFLVMFYYFPSVPPIFGALGTGIAYCIVTPALMAVVPWLIEDKYVSKMYGFSFFAMNLGFALNVLVTGWIVDNIGWEWVFILYIILLGIAFVLSIFLNILKFKLLNSNAEADSEETPLIN